MKSVIASIFFILLLVGSLQSFAEKKQIDSLETKLLLVDDSTKLIVLDELSKLYFRNAPKKAYNRALKAIELAKKTGSQEQMSMALRNFSLSNAYLLADYDKALELAFSALKNDENFNLDRSLVKTKLTIATIYTEVGNSLKANETLQQALELAQSLNDKSLEFEVVKMQGENALSQNNFESASLLFRKALQLSKLIDQAYQQANAHYALARFYSKTGNLDLASEHLFRSIDLLKNTKHKILLATVYNLTGDLMVIKEQNGTAFQYHHQAKSIREAENDTKGLAETHLSMAAPLLANEDFRQAITHLVKAQVYAEQVNEKYLLRRCYNELYSAYSAIGNESLATEYKEKFGGISELILGEEDEKKITELEYKFDMEKKNLELLSLEQQNKIQELEIQRERSFSIVIVGFSGVIVILMVFAYKSFSDKRKANEELERLNDLMRQQNLKLKELNDTKNKFFSIIGHDLKGPLNSLTSFSGLLVNHYGSLSEDEVKMLAKDLDTSVKNLFSLLENLLTWARSQTGKVDITPERFNLKGIVEPTISVLKKTAENKGIELKYEGEEYPYAYGDTNTLTTVLRNLISNSLKFTPDGGQVTVSTQEYKDAVEISVKDTGVGMSPEVQKKIFDVGKKHTTLGTNKEKGTGLGLVLCKEFVEKNGGAISVESEEGKGTCFRFTIPTSADS